MVRIPFIEASWIIVVNTEAIIYSVGLRNKIFVWYVRMKRTRKAAMIKKNDRPMKLQSMNPLNKSFLIESRVFVASKCHLSMKWWKLEERFCICLVESFVREKFQCKYDDDRDKITHKHTHIIDTQEIKCQLEPDQINSEVNVSRKWIRIIKYGYNVKTNRIESNENHKCRTITWCNP